MKKTILTITAVILLAFGSLLGLTACGSSNFQNCPVDIASRLVVSEVDGDLYLEMTITNRYSNKTLRGLSFAIQMVATHQSGDSHEWKYGNGKTPMEVNLSGLQTGVYSYKVASLALGEGQAFTLVKIDSSLFISFLKFDDGSTWGKSDISFDSIVKRGQKFNVDVYYHV